MKSSFAQDIDLFAFWAAIAIGAVAIALIIIYEFHSRQKKS